MPDITNLHTGAVTVIDYKCTATSHDTPFTEIHQSHSISYVRKGSFGCKYRGEELDLVAGSIFVGCTGEEYICTHSHYNGGDECLSFHITPQFLDSIGDHFTNWRIGCIPPIPELMVFGELAQACAEGRSNLGIEEVGMFFTHRFVNVVSGRKGSTTQIRAQDRKRATSSAIWIYEHATEAISLESAAQESGLSTFHFLRVFKNVLGVTPHQYLVRSRLRRAARLLTEDDRPITEIAFDAGFTDISNFVRTFHRAAGVSPTSFRKAAKANSKIFQEQINKSI